MSNSTEVRDTRRTITYIARALTYVIYFFLVAVEIILALGFFLLMFGANPTAPFVEWAYRNLDRAMAPFRGIFAPIELGTAGNDVEAVFDTSVLFAMIVYGIVAILLHSLIIWLTGRINRMDYEREMSQHAARYAQAASMSASDGSATPSSAQWPTETEAPPGTYGS